MRNVLVFRVFIVGDIFRGKVLFMIKNKVVIVIEVNVNKYMGV